MREIDAKPSRLRADAERNRQRIIEAAREAFTWHGVEVPMATIARKAGVGVATLYRRFPTRDELIREIFADQLQACSAALDEALDDPDPWRGFCHVIEKVCALQAAERGFTEAFLNAFPDAAADHSRRRLEGERGFAALVRRAQRAGALRTDFHPSDLTVVLLANNALSATPDPAAASRRLVSYLLDSFRADAAHTPLPPPTGLGLGHLLPAGHRARPTQGSIE
ncbi:TetR/AcrR family transcriptional regulator [Streptomyces niger]|uniref:TetR/AcrR family transcriptional regulator n=1 Tax=Streptomyces niger TaxID=66373 RepID=UPI001F30AD4F|nr:TetR/AcrR family transcriptional regulator [Streptomyces niger]